MTLYTSVLWCYVVMISVVFGAGVYEAFVVHPAWSRTPPESFRWFTGTAVSRMNLAGFWKPVAPLWALSALATLGLALSAGNHENAIIVSTVCTVGVVVWTLVYFRPNVERFLTHGGGEAPPERLQAEARRWVALNWVRLVLTTIAWWGALTTLANHR